MEMTSRRHFLAVAGSTAPLMAASATRSSSPARAPGLLAGKVAVIYGAAGDMGSGVSRAFASEGAHVVLAGRTLDKLEKLARELSAGGGDVEAARVEAARVDALDREQVEKHLDAVVAAHGRVDISFNLINLGGAQGMPLTDLTQGAFAEPIGNAMRTHFLTATAAGRRMIRQKSGVILALTAQVARKPYTNSGGFGVACAAIEGLCRQLAIELGPAGVRVVTLRSSGSFDAAGVAAAIAEHARAAGVSLDAFKAGIAEKTMLKRMPAVAEIANAAVMMAADRASAITAAVINATCGEIAD